MDKEMLKIVRDIGASEGLPLSMAEEIVRAVNAHYKSKVPKKKEVPIDRITSVIPPWL